MFFSVLQLQQFFGYGLENLNPHLPVIRVKHPENLYADTARAYNLPMTARVAGSVYPFSFHTQEDNTFF